MIWRTWIWLEINLQGFNVNVNNREASSMHAAPAAVRGMPLHYCCSPPIDLKCAARPTMESQAVGGSARQRSFWLCYAWEAILEIFLLCSSITLRGYLQSFVFIFNQKNILGICWSAVISIIWVSVRRDAGGSLCVFRDSNRNLLPLDYAPRNNNIHGLEPRGQVVILTYYE